MLSSDLESTMHAILSLICLSGVCIYELILQLGRGLQNSIYCIMGYEQWRNLLFRYYQGMLVVLLSSRDLVLISPMHMLEQVLSFIP